MILTTNVMQLTEAQRIALRDRKKAPSKFDESRIGKAVLSLPRNLMMITINLIGFSFIFMMYVVYTEQDLTEIVFGGGDKKVSDLSPVNRLHPFMMQLQDRAMLQHEDSLGELQTRRKLLAANEKLFDSFI